MHLYLLNKTLSQTYFRTASTVCSPVTHLIGLRWIIRNTELLQKEQACIIVSNHQSSLDVLGKFSAMLLPTLTYIWLCAGMFQFWHIMGKCTVIAKRELLYAGPFGLAAWLAGLIFIPRMQSEKAKQIMHDASVHIKQEKVCIFIHITAFSFTVLFQSVCENAIRNFRDDPHFVFLVFEFQCMFMSAIFVFYFKYLPTSSYKITN